MNSKPKYFEEGWRIGVGIVLVNKNKRIFMGERLDSKGAWQMPQGGVNIFSNENLLDAAKRELYEETGVKKIEILAKSINWYYYHLPKNLRRKLWKGRFIGQKQKWFIFSFLGSDQDINVNANDKPEFEKWKWVDPADILDNVINFKKDTYSKVLDEFKLLLNRT